MNDQQVREIVEAAFQAHFDDMKVVRVNIQSKARPRRTWR